MIERRSCIGWAAGAFVASGAFALAIPLPVRAQPAPKAPRVALLTALENAALVDEFRKAMRDLGWIDGRNVVLDIRFGSDAARLRELAGELQAQGVAMILASGTTAIRAVRDGAPATPIVMVNAGDPLGAGFAASLANPGGLMTGTSAAGQEVLPKQLELLAAAAPQVRRVGILMNTANPANDFFFDVLSQRARALGLQLVRLEVSQAAGIEAALARVGSGGGVLVVGDPLFFAQRRRIAQAALAMRMPSMFGVRDHVADGGLMYYNSSYAWHFRAAAGFVDKILKGEMPADLPIQQPTQFVLGLNASVARALGLTIPPAVLLRADEVIE